MGGSSKKQTVGYRYFLGMHMILCHGHSDALIRIRVDDKDAWLGLEDGGQIVINKKDLFGGESREGGVSGIVDVEMGTPTQGQNSYLVSKLGSLVPSFRGVVGIVLRQCYLGLNPYLKKWAFRLQRIHKRQTGIAQWYDGKSAIGEISQQFDINLNVSNAGTNPNVGISISGLSSSDYLVVYRPNETMTYTAMRGWPADNTDPLPWGHWFQIVGSDGSSTLHWYEWFATAEEALTFAKSQGQVFRTGSTEYKIYIPDGNLADNVGGISLRVAIVKGTLDMNPAHIIRECLTDPDWGMGYQDADIDDASFIKAADALYAEGMGISLIWDRQTSIEEFIKEIAKHIDAALFVDRQTGKFTLKLIRNDYVLADLLVLNPNNVDKIADFARPAFGELTNSITVNYWDSATGTDASLTVQDIALSQMQGVTINTTVQYPGFTKKSIAGRVAQRDLKTLSTLLISCTIYANRDAASLNIGSCFKLTWPDYDLNEVVMRVTGIAYGDGRTNRVRINCSQDVFSLPETSFIPPTPPIWEDPNSDAAPTPYRVVVEAPYYELVQRLGQTNADQQISANNDIGYLIVSAAAPSGAINGRLAVDNGAGYENNDYPMDFCPVGFLTGAVDYDDTVIPLTGFVGSSSVVLGTHAQIGSELVKITAVASDSITVGRGVLDTVPTSHVAETPVLFWDAFGDSDNVEYVTNETINVKILPTTGRGTLAIDSAPEDSLTFASRAYKPYPPGNVKVNSLAYPATISSSDALTVSWSHRDRLQQTAGDIVDTTAGNIGPEVGTTYTLKIYKEDGTTLLHTESGVSTTSYTYPLATEISDSGIVYQTGGSVFNLTERTSSFTNDRIWDVTYLASSINLFVAVGENSKIATSPDGINWTQRTSSFGSTDAINAIANNGNNLFCAISSSAKIATSPDGINWTQRTSGFSVSIRCVEHNKSSMWVAAGDSGALRTSADGITWTGRTSSFGTTRIWGVCFGASLWIICGESGKIATSPDGINWTQRTSSFGSTDTIYDIYYGNGLFIACGANGKIATSPDGINWTLRTAPLQTYLKVEFFNGLFTIASADGAFATSPDGINWTLRTSSFSIVWRSLISNGLNLLVFVGDSAKLATSPGLEFVDVIYRQNGKLRFTLQSVRDGYNSYQMHDYTVSRTGYGFNYGERYGS